MKSRIILGVLLALALAAPAMARTSLSIGINIAPPVVTYHQEPHWVHPNGARVWIVDDPALGYDYFRYGGWYWIYDRDTWFRSRRYNGPWMGVRSEVVPGPIWRMGDREHYNWRHRPGAVPQRWAR